MRRSILLTLIAAIALAGCATRGSRDDDIRDDIWGPDSARIAWLHANGRHTDRAHTVLWVPPDMPDARLQALGDTLERGVAAALTLLASARTHSRLGRRPIAYYISPDTFISHATGEAAVMISRWRAESGLAPYKHEAIHEILLPPPPYWSEEYATAADSAAVEASWPDWLVEGLPDYLAYRIARDEGLPEGDIFGNGGLDGVDRVCAERMAADSAGIVRRYVPGRGTPPALFTERRREVAPLFYACAGSFVKYLVGRVGVDAVVALVPRRDPLAALEAATGSSAEALQAAWLASLPR